MLMFVLLAFWLLGGVDLWVCFLVAIDLLL